MRSGTAAWGWLAAILLLGAVAGCGSGGDGDEAASGDPTPTTAASPTMVPGGCEVPPAPTAEPDYGDPTEPELRDELLAMFEADQAERTGDGPITDDADRTDRLREIIEDYGWPTRRMVGVDGATAAWVIAQHSDHDVDFQREALALMCQAAAAGEADVTELAYLVDRVAVNSDQPQIYGTQVGPCEDGRPVPQPLWDEARVDERRARVGLEPLADYLAQFEEGCASGG
ncbi:MAG TPA: DUF6624 domain-containing protein [Natronosporangium sp.]